MIEMKLLTPEEMRAVDKAATVEYKIPSLLLMEHAAYQIFSYIKENEDGKEIVIVCGPGNNGGDGLALARQLKAFSSCKVKVLLLCSKEKLSEDGKVYYEICQNMDIDLFHIKEDNKQAWLENIQKASIIVDAIFGTGLSRMVEGLFYEVMSEINKANCKVISIDIPSGINGLTGKVQGIAIKADLTITFVRPKLGLYLYPAILYTGEVRVVNIGMPDGLLEKINTHYFSIEQDEMKTILPRREIRSNKGSYGKVLTIGGSLGMAGAISLTSMAAYRGGCGTVTTAIPKCIIEIMQQKLTEVMAIGLEDEAGHFSKGAVSELRKILPNYEVIAIGPGIGRSEAVLSLVKEVLLNNKPCILDADALYFVPEVLEMIKARKVATIMTPHPGEMGRMMGVTTHAILDKPIQYAREFATKFNVITVLKLEKTVIAHTDGNIYINKCGNTGLAKGGSGDVLTGIITGLLAQHMVPIEAAMLGVYLQTRAADLAKESLSERSFVASDVIHSLGKVFLELR